MAQFYLVLPDGTEADLTQPHTVSLTDVARVDVRPGDAQYRLHNTGTVGVAVDTEYGVRELMPNESEELKETCQFYIEADRDSTLHHVEALTRSKRRRKQSPEEQSAVFGYQLYRLRDRKNLGMTAMECDLNTWLDGDVQYLCLSDYMIDLDWLFSAVPKLATIEQVLLIHGEMRDDHLKSSIERNGLGGQVALHKPPLPIPFGTHHSKACIVKFPRGLRVIVHTANLIHADCGNKTQGVWIQDFPPKVVKPSGSFFESDLLQYLTALQIPMTHRRTLFNLIRAHDFSAARVKLIASVPGYHKGVAMHHYGHLAVRRALEQEVFQRDFDSAPLVCQFSSLGSLDEKWLYDEFMASFSAGRGENELEQLRPPSRDAQGLQLIWPTVAQVRESIEGWDAGRSIPGPAKNVQKPFLKKHWHRFEGGHLDRSDAMPHIKTYTRYADGQLSWVLLASHNLSKAAWGALQKKGTQFMIRSYELGVLFLPSLEREFCRSPNADFSATSLTPIAVTSNAASFQPYPAADSTAQGNPLQFCLPFQIPPEAYKEEDQPWTVDTRMPGLDRLCRKWGTGESMYGHLESS